QGNLEEALASYQQALRLKPDHAEAHRNRALALLLAGQYEQGWPEFEWRWRCKRFFLSPCSLPRWGGPPPQGPAHLLRGRAGFGRHLAVRPLRRTAEATGRHRRRGVPEVPAAPPGRLPRHRPTAGPGRAHPRRGGRAGSPDEPAGPAGHLPGPGARHGPL